jgi:hypothetical protein
MSEISIGRDHEFPHILWAMCRSEHVLFCSVCGSRLGMAHGYVGR